MRNNIINHGDDSYEANDIDDVEVDKGATTYMIHR
jgi:hypothetical protein